MPEPFPSQEISIKELFKNISEWWRYLLTKWIKILVAGFLFGVFGFCFAWLQPMKYTAKVTFVLEEGKSNMSSLGSIASLAGQFGVDLGGASGGGVFSGDNILLYFKSPSILKEVLLTQYLGTSNESVADNYARVYKLDKTWASIKKIGKVKFYPLNYNKPYSRLQDSLIQGMIKDIIESQLIVERADKKSSFIEVSTKMENEELSKFFCEHIVKVAVDRYLNIKTKRQKTTVDKLQARLDSIDNLLTKKTLIGANLQTSASTMDINPLYKSNTSVAVETTLRDKTLLATIYATITQNLEIAKFTLSQETPVIQVVDTPFFPLKKERLSRYKTALLFSFIFEIFYVCFLLYRGRNKY